MDKNAYASTSRKEDDQQDLGQRVLRGRREEWSKERDSVGTEKEWRVVSVIK